MTIISQQDIFSVGNNPDLELQTVSVTVISAPDAPGGNGRLTHPTLGTYDYDIAPSEWKNVDTGIMTPPVWAHTRTLTGVASTLWAGSIKDVEVVEKWFGNVAMRAPQLRMLLDMWQNPPSSGNVVWAPNYITANTYNVQIVKVTAGGGDVTLDYRMLQNDGYVKGPVEIVYRILGEV